MLLIKLLYMKLVQVEVTVDVMDVSLVVPERIVATEEVESIP